MDVWLWRARFAKTRAAAQRMVSEGGVRLIRDGASRRLEKPSTEVAVGDGLAFVHGRELRALRIVALGGRRGPAAEARALYDPQDGL